MDTFTAVAIDDLPQLYDGLIKLAREGLGIDGFGVQIMDLPPGYTTGSHDESGTGQQELYTALRGSGGLIVDGECLPLGPGRLVAVPPHQERTLASGADGLRVLCVGGAPGRPYEAPDWTAAS